MKQMIGLIAGAASILSPLFAAPPTNFVSRGIGGGGAMYSPTINPHNGEEMYVGCDMSLQFHTADGGRHWEILPFRQFQSGHDAAVRFTRDPQIRWAINYLTVGGAETARPSRSTDGGLTWAMPPSEAWDPTDSAYSLWADYDHPDRALASQYGWLFRTTDGGRTWQNVLAAANRNNGLFVGGAFFDGETIYLGTSDGLQVSKDGGRTWQVDPTPGLPANARMLSLAGAKVGSRIRLYAVLSRNVWPGITGADGGGYEGIYALDMGAAAWQPRINGIPPAAHPFFVRMATNDLDMAYVAGGNSCPGTGPCVFKTTDGGATWQDIFLLEGNRNIVCGYSGDKGDMGWSYGEYALGFDVSPSDSRRAVVSDLGFAHVTTDGGATWRQVYTQPLDIRKVGAIPAKGRYVGVGMEMTSIWDLEWFDTKNLFACATDIRGIRSDDGGQSWSFNYTGHDLNTMYRVVRDEAHGVAYAGASSIHDMYLSTYLADAKIDRGMGRVLYTTDKGATWKAMRDMRHPVVWLALDPTRPNRLYAAVVHSQEGGIYVTDDRDQNEKASWTRLPAPPRTEGHPYNVVTLHDGTIVSTWSGRRAPKEFTASSGVFVSSDGGKTWEDRSDAGMKFWVKDILLDPRDKQQNTWYACVFHAWGKTARDGGGRSGLYRTRDRGKTWARIADESLSAAKVLNVNSGAFNPQNPKEFYMTTEYDGLLWTPDVAAEKPDFRPVESFRFAQPMRIRFNPAKPSEMWVTSVGNGISVGECGQ